ncbi:MAG TPA: hypothetical protein VGM18_18130 [Candidatus Sulfotelmatobacter sp.]|jgi:hypothetical protein
MEIRVNVPEELATQARERGVPVETYVEELLAQTVAFSDETSPEEPLVPKKPRLLVDAKTPRTPEQVRAWLEALAQFSDKIPPLPETISREWIYQDHD